MQVDSLLNILPDSAKIADSIAKIDSLSLINVAQTIPSQNSYNLDYALVITILGTIITTIALFITIKSSSQSKRLKVLIAETSNAATSANSASQDAKSAATEAKEASKEANDAAKNAESASTQTKEAAIEAKLASNAAVDASNEAKEASKQTVNNSIEIKKATDQIADYTRKPLVGIENVLFQVHKLLKYHVDHSKFWYLGFTLGIGPIHDVEEIRMKWNELDSDSEDFVSFQEMYKQININLKKSLKSSKGAHIACLNNNKLCDEFIKPLYAKRYDISEFDQKTLLEKINEYHDSVENVINSNTDIKSEVKYIETLPIQVIMTEIYKDGENKFAVVVFHVGTQNIGSKVLGFYSEAQNICELFGDYVESLCNN